MITFSLICKNNHRFEGWFRSSQDYDEQIQKNLISCPQCNSIKISKALMAPAVKSSKKTNKEKNNQVNSQNLENIEKKALVGEYDIRQALRNFRSYIEKNCENVGDKFANEARSISKGEAKERNIYGKVSNEEAKELLDEGIEVSAIPWIKDDS